VVEEGRRLPNLPRSFKDSNGDGIGDLKGVSSETRLPQDLGVDVIWLSPHFDSPNADNGIRHRDYRKVMAEFGTMADFDEMLKGIKQRQHEATARPGREPHQRRARLVRREPQIERQPLPAITTFGRAGRDGNPPNTGLPSSPAPPGNKTRPPANTTSTCSPRSSPTSTGTNPKVRNEVYGLMKFWLDKGVDGFRMDVIPFISKRPRVFPDYPKEYEGRVQFFYAAGPKVHDYIREMNREVLSKYDVMTVAEAFGVSLEQTPLLVDDAATNST